MWGRRLQLRFYLLMLAAGVAAGMNGVQQSPPDAPAAFEQAIAQLVAEATEAKSNLRLLHDEADFAGRFGQDLPADSVIAAILEPQHRDPFIDAYVRWQLTSFDPHLPAFDDAVFARFLARTPRMVNNPKADAAMLSALKQAERAGRLPPQRVAQIRQVVETLNEREVIAELMNRPADQYREWMAEKLGERGMYPRLWMLERLAAEIVGGWSVRSTKSGISRNFLASINDDTFTAEQRRMVVLEAQRLVGPGRSRLREVTFLADGSITVSISTSKVTNDDIDNWRKRLNGIKPD